MLVIIMSVVPNTIKLMWLNSGYLDALFVDILTLFLGMVLFALIDHIT